MYNIILQLVSIFHCISPCANIISLRKEISPSFYFYYIRNNTVTKPSMYNVENLSERSSNVQSEFGFDKMRNDCVMFFNITKKNFCTYFLLLRSTDSIM